MKLNAINVKEYLEQVPPERQKAFRRLRQVIKKNLPPGFSEEMSYGMIGYVVPHRLYPPGYHCDPSLPLPFVSIASQKNYVALYHMGIYMKKNILPWFEKEYARGYAVKLDSGKCCLRFKKMELIPFVLIGELMKKISVDEWVKHYEKTLKPGSRKTTSTRK